MVNIQLTRARERVNIREIVDRLISAFSTRDPVNGVTRPLSEVSTSSLAAMSCESTTKLPSGLATMNRAMYTELFVVGSMAMAKARRA